MITAVILGFSENMGWNQKSRKEKFGGTNKKVRDVRHEISSGKYNITKKLDVVLDRLLEEILK